MEEIILSSFYLDIYSLFCAIHWFHNTRFQCCPIKNLHTFNLCFCMSCQAVDEETAELAWIYSFLVHSVLLREYVCSNNVVWNRLFFCWYFLLHQYRLFWLVIRALSNASQNYFKMVKNRTRGGGANNRKDNIKSVQRRFHTKTVHKSRGIPQFPHQLAW